MMDNLLNLIAEKNHCYISDLHYKSDIPTLLHEVNVEDYSIAEWNYTISYIQGGDCSFQTYDEVKKYISLEH